MADDSKFNIILTLSTDKASAADILKILNLLTNQTKQLTGANAGSAAAFDKAFNAARKAAQGAKDNAAANKTVADVLQQIARQKALDDLALKWSRVAKATKDAAAAQAGLQKDLTDLNASDLEIQRTAGQFAETGGRNALQKVGANIRNLPSVQIPGLGIGTDAIGNLTRVAGALAEPVQGLISKFTLLTTVQTALTPALGATAAGFATMVVAAAPFLIIIGAVALAIKSAADQIQARMAALETSLEARRSAVEAAFSGTTTEEAKKKMEQFNQTIAAQSKIIDENTAKIGNANALVEQQAGSFFTLGQKIGVATTDTAEWQEQIDKSTPILQTAQAGQEAWQDAIEQGLFALNDQIALERQLAEERTKGVLDAANAAGQEVQFRQRANKATFEQNTERLQAIEDERAVIQAQIDSLVSSGDTSEEVTSQIDKLNGSLSNLGKESEFITSTALAASKARDAEKKAIKDAEKAREEAQRKQEQADQKRLEAGKNYSKAIIDIATRAADSAEDALRGMQDKFAANQTGFDRDITALSVKAGQSRIEAEIEAQQEEAADLREHQRSLESIRDDALADEDDALKKRDFLGAARIREAANRELEAENKAFQDGQTEKNIALQEAAEKENRELDNARQARLVQLQQQNDDARTAYDLRLRDDKIAQDRSERDAATARDRELQAARELADGVLAIKGAQAAAELGIAQGLIANISNMMNQFQAPQMAFNQGSGSNTTNQNIRSTGNLNFAINGAASPANIQSQMMQFLGQVGLMPDR